MNYFPGRRCDPELAAPANRRALTTDDLTQMVDDAAEYAGQANASADRAEQVVEGVDASIIVVDAAVAQAEGYAQSAQEAQEGANSSAGEAATQATNAGLSAASAAGSATTAEVAAASVAKGQPNGTAPLDGSAKLPEANIPDRLGADALARLDRMLEMTSLYGPGDSQARNPSQGADLGTQFLDRLYHRHNFKEYVVKGIAGATMAQIASDSLTWWAPNSRGLVVLCSGIGNTSTQFGADGQASAALAFRTLMANFASRAKFSVSSTTFAFDPSWSGGTSSTANSVFDFGVNGDTAYLLVNTATGSGGVLEIRNGSTLVATINTGNHKAVFPGAYKITGLGSGDHILRGKLVSGSATISALLIPASTPAQVVWVTVDPSRSNVAQRQSYIDACESVLVDFPGVVRVTPGADWNPLLHISDEDGLHLNDRGNAYMTDRIESVLASLLDFSQGLNRISRSTADLPYVGPTPSPIVVVTTYASDSFDRTNGALGSTEVGNRPWSLSVASSVSIVNNAAEWATASATAGTIAYIEDGQALGKVTAEGINAATYGVFGFGDASLNGYYMFHSNNNGWRIGIRTPSGFTPLATAGSTTPPSTAVTIDLVRGSNGSLTGFVDGSPVVTATDSTYSGTRHGIISLVSGRRVTAWRHTDI